MGLFGRKRPQGALLESARAGWGSRVIGGLSEASADAVRARPYHHGDLRQALLDATLALIEENGPQGFTLRGAARRAGVTPAATYHHFKDKDDLIAAVAQEGFDLLWNELNAAAERPVPSARERSRNVGVAYVLFAIEHPTRFRVMLGYGVSRAGPSSAADEAVASYRFVRELLLAELAQDSSQDVSEAHVLGWWSVVHGLAFLAIDGYLGKVTKSGKRAEEVVRAVIDALDRRPAESSAVRRRQTL